MRLPPCDALSTLEQTHRHVRHHFVSRVNLFNGDFLNQNYVFRSCDKTPLDYAKFFEHKDVIDFLKNLEVVTTGPTKTIKFK